ncbi:FGGY-family carbohydrate kinase [Oricola thermophila]|uniref:FGGY-family carbohydrate kinase n=1 Tax=Oricola thermophila TaxID=2742145 RepID=A0A6N1VAC2_9HYPH|nr:FGGY-family carbohydrate kinase [Oricola thermophila]QKV17914.1 FGGY-family carbohydrate kinase [Oricola thermophila]
MERGNGLYFIGVDVGTGSARAGVFDEKGTLLAAESHPIRIWREKPLHVEQSSDDIWAAVASCVRKAVGQSGIGAEHVAGIGFDATCSLVVLDRQGAPLAVNAEGDNARNIIVWMDHRATPQAKRINETGAGVLDYVGGRISPEMQTPKLLWLAEELPRTFDGAGHFLDLTDFLTWRATGSLWRSTCTVTCKWTYLAHEDRWDPDYFRQVGLGRLADEGFERIGNRICPPGTAIPGSLRDTAADELGLNPGTAVAVGLIDAHAGALGTLGAEGLDGTLEQRLAYVFGTSACTLNVGAEPAFVPGVWGPYHSALVPGLWLNEGGQSAAGAAIDHLVRQHGLAAETGKKAQAEGMGLTAWLERRATALLRQRSFGEIVGGLHVVAEFLGNRAPFADPDARAVIAGLDMAQDEESLVRLYLAGVASIGYGLRQIAETLRDKGADLKQVVISGGAGRSPLVRQILADATGLSIATCASPEPVLLGSAMTAAVAAGHQPDLRTAMSALSRMDQATTPDREQAPLHARRYDAFTALQDMERRLRQDAF